VKLIWYLPPVNETNAGYGWASLSMQDVYSPCQPYTLHCTNTIIGNFGGL